MTALRSLWVHNFDPGIAMGGVFMHVLADAVQAQGVQVDMLYTGRLSSALEIWRARRLLRELAGDFDVVHAQYGSMCSLVAAAAPGLRIVSLRGSDWYRTPNGTFRQRVHGNLGNFLTRRALPHYDRVIVMSHAMREELERHGHGRTRGRIEVVTDGLDLEMFQPRDRAACRAQLGCPGDTRPWVLMTTLFEDNPIKRVPLAKAAVALAQQRLPDLQLKVASNRPHHEMPLWVNACDAILLTSDHEGWPNAIKEALACDVPFVSTDVSDLARIARVEPACRTADAHPQALADALVQVLSREGPVNLRHHVAGMEVHEVARRLCGVYHDMVSAGVTSSVAGV